MVSERQKCILYRLDEIASVCEKMKQLCPNDWVLKKVCVLEGFYYDEISLKDLLHGVKRLVTLTKEVCKVEFEK